MTQKRVSLTLWTQTISWLDPKHFGNRKGQPSPLSHHFQPEKTWKFFPDSVVFIYKVPGFHLDTLSLAKTLTGKFIGQLWKLVLESGKRQKDRRKGRRTGRLVQYETICSGAAICGCRKKKSEKQRNRLLLRVLAKPTVNPSGQRTTPSQLVNKPALLATH